MPPKRKRVVAKKSTQVASENENKKVSDDSDECVELPVKPSTKRNRAPIVKQPESENSSESEVEEKPAKKVRAANKKEPAKKTTKSTEKIPKETKSNAASKESVPKATTKNQTSTSYSDLDLTSSATSASGEKWNFKISNWNVDGIRAWIKKGGLDFIEFEKPDVFCIQETKCSEAKIPPEAKEVPGYKAYWHCSKKEGYAGVGLYSKTEPISVEYGLGDDEYDNEGRMITAEYKEFYVVSVYVPNAGRGLVTLPKRLEWNDAFRNYIGDLDKKKPVIVCGDMNVSHLEIDLSNPKTNTKNAGFTKEERDGMTEFLSDGYVDTFRKLYPEKTQAYTFWTYMSNCRAKNVGWRLDYLIVSERLVDNVCDNIIRNQIFGSDHCPITLFLTV